MNAPLSVCVCLSSLLFFGKAKKEERLGKQRERERERRKSESYFNVFYFFAFVLFLFLIPITSANV